MSLKELMINAIKSWWWTYNTKYQTDIEGKTIYAPINDRFKDEEDFVIYLYGLSNEKLLEVYTKKTIDIAVQDF